MAKNRLLLHVGAPKCGSTALQAAWARTQEFTTTYGERFRYALIDSDGDLVMGNEATRRATRSLSQTAPSANIRPIGKFAVPVRRFIVEELNAALQDSSIILSQESWLRRPQEFGALKILQRVKSPIDIVAYVRPQADFLNASWWQWGAWQDVGFQVWREREDITLTHWAELLEAWRALPNVRTVYPRLLQGDVVEDFYKLVLATPPEGDSVANRSLPKAALRLMQRRPELRPARAGSDMHFALGRALETFEQGTPWVLPQDFVEHILHACQESNVRLRAMLDQASQEKMDADPRWWTASAYAGRRLDSPETPDAPTDAEEIAAALAERLMLVERELSRFRAKLVPHDPPRPAEPVAQQHERAADGVLEPAPTAAK